MMATLAFVKKWSVNLLGRHFQIKNDHYSLKFLLDQHANTPTQQAWIIKMMGYDYEVTFKKGSSNTMADTLSKRPQQQLFAILIVTGDLLQRIRHSWLSESFFVHLLHKLKSSPNKSSKYSWQGDQLRRKRKLMVGQDPKLRDELLSLFHSSPKGAILELKVR